MTEVTVNDKVFVPYITPHRIHERVKELGIAINADYNGITPVCLGVLNGAFIFMADLVRELNCRPELGFIGLSSYGNRMESSGEVKKTMGMNVYVKGRDVLVIEDIVDEGRTIEWLKQELIAQGATSVKVAVLLFKPGAFKGTKRPEYVGFEISNEFVVGNGLDYAGSGRELNGIFQLKP